MNDELRTALQKTERDLAHIAELAKSMGQSVDRMGQDIQRLREHWRESWERQQALLRRAGVIVR